jgi:hypothetical protein
MTREHVPVHDRSTTLIIMGLVVGMTMLMAFLVLSLTHSMSAY